MSQDISPQGIAFRDGLYKDALARTRVYLPHEQASALAEQIVSDTISRLISLRTGYRPRPVSRRPKMTESIV
jgi:hypothetical protein